MKTKEGRLKIYKELVEWAVCIIVAFIIYLFINYFIGTISGVKQVSMTPTAVEGERVYISRTIFFQKELVRGDIVTFSSPAGLNDMDTEPSEFTLTGDNAIASFEDLNFGEAFVHDFLGINKVSYIKRVIGVASDHVYIDEDGNVFVNDVKLEENYLNDGTTNRNGKYIDVIVPEGSVFVMGDNRLHSMDSRYFGCVPLEEIEGYVEAKVWPLDKIGPL